MWCPSVSLSVWANAWLAGRAAPDDVLDALSAWAPVQSVAAYDGIVAANSGLPWPDVDDAGAMSLLQTVRAAVRGRASRSIRLVLPVPGDVRGLPAGTQFARDALAVGEAILLAGPHDSTAAVGLVPAYDESESLAWTVYDLSGAPVAEQRDLGQAEHDLRSAVRAAAEALATLRADTGSLDVDDPRAMVEELLEALRRHRIPDHAPSRALRVLENAAHVDAIITVGAGLLPISAPSSSAAQSVGDALRPLSGVVRAARLAAVDAIVQSAWR